MSDLLSIGDEFLSSASSFLNAILAIKSDFANALSMAFLNARRSWSSAAV